MKKIISWVKKHKYFSLALFLVLIVGGYYWQNKKSAENSALQYRTATAERGELTVAVSGSGNVIVDSSANVDPTITGTVANLKVAVGDQVTKGQLLFEIENDDLALNAAKANASYLQALQAVESAKANKKQAKADYEDANSSDHNILKQKLEAAEWSVTVAQENVSTALANYQNEKKNYAERQVVAPITGTVNAVNIKNGDDLSKLSSGSSREVPIIIGDLETLKAQVAVSEVDIASVAIGQKAVLTFNALDDFTALGKVEKMDSLGTSTSGVVTYKVTIGFEELDSRIKPEMSVSASIVTEVRENVVIVPSSAVKTEGQNYYVEVMQNNVPTKKRVEIGLENNSKTEIKGGIKEGEIVVTQTSKSSQSSSNDSSSNSSQRSGNRPPGGMRLPGM